MRIELDGNKARQGETLGVMRYVLGFRGHNTELPCRSVGTQRH